MDIIPKDSNVEFADLPAIRLEPRAYSVWVDGSFLDKNRNKAGVGIIVTPAEEPDNAVLALAYNLSNMGIRDSKYTELWAATLALEDMRKFPISCLTFDSPITEDRITSIRTDEFNAERVLPELIEFPQLYERLWQAVQDHPDMALSHKKRSLENMPHADKFSRISATRRLAKIFSYANEMDIPCLYRLINKEGEVRKTQFFDRMENYDIQDYITGPFQRPDIDDQAGTLDQDLGID